MIDGGITPSHIKPFDLRHVSDESNRHLGRVDSRAWSVDPFDGDLGNLEFELLGQVQDFKVE